MNHTPGPWATHKTEGNGGNIPDRLEIVGPEEGRKRSLIASIYGFKLSEGQANAQLIAAAPELYEALEAAYMVLKPQKSRFKDYVDAVTLARAALAKARGEEGIEG